MTTEEHNPSSETGTHAGFVALIGQPNVGKSTLMNQVLGVKVAITTSKPQTTRNRILGVRTWSEKGQVCFVDTPGIHQSKKRLNKALVKAAVDSLEDVDVVCHVIDAAALAGAAKRGELAEMWDRESIIFDQLNKIDLPIVVVMNKVDLVKPKELLLPLIAELQERTTSKHLVPVSAKSGDNVDQLVDVLMDHLPEQPLIFPEDMLTDQAERFIAAEFVRQEVMDQTRKEIPYSAAVEVERFQESQNGEILEISVVIHVERDSQKGIVIGKGGARLRDIGQKARAELETFFGRKVYLETFVRVQSEWSEDPRALQRFGYEK